MSELDELRDAAKSDVKQDFGTTWSAKEEGDELSGTIETIEYIGSKYGEKYVVGIRDEAGDLHSLWISGTVLENRFLEMAPGVGSLIVVIFKGKKKTKSGDRSYNNFHIVANKLNCHQEWMDAKAAFDLKASLKSPEVGAGGITAPGDDSQMNPF